MQFYFREMSDLKKELCDMSEKLENDIQQMEEMKKR